MKFQDPSMHASKVTGGIKKSVTDGQMDAQAKLNMPHQLFQKRRMHSLQN